MIFYTLLRALSSNSSALPPPNQPVPNLAWSSESKLSRLDREGRKWFRVIDELSYQNHDIVGLDRNVWEM